jgi:hypothetical protein
MWEASGMPGTQPAYSARPLSVVSSIASQTMLAAQQQQRLMLLSHLVTAYALTGRAQATGAPMHITVGDVQAAAAVVQRHYSLHTPVALREMLVATIQQAVPPRLDQQLIRPTSYWLTAAQLQAATAAVMVALSSQTSAMPHTALPSLPTAALNPMHYPAAYKPKADMHTAKSPAIAAHVIPSRAGPSLTAAAMGLSASAALLSATPTTKPVAAAAAMATTSRLTHMTPTTLPKRPAAALQPSAVACAASMSRPTQKAVAAPAVIPSSMAASRPVMGPMQPDIPAAGSQLPPSQPQPPIMPTVFAKASADARPPYTLGKAPALVCFQCHAGVEQQGEL